MPGAMFFKECGKTVKSITYLVFVAVLILFCYTQFWSGLEIIEKPQQGQESYGTKYEEEPKIIIPNAVKNLYREFVSNSYIAYPMGFYKNVRLNDKKQGEMAGILSQLTGILKDDFMKSIGMESAGSTLNIDTGMAENMIRNEDGSYQLVIPDGQGDKEERANTEATIEAETEAESGIGIGAGSTGITEVAVDEALTYESFLKLMGQADKLIGGGSRYDGIYLIHFGEVPMTYEDALTEYDNIVVKDRVTGAYARLFCDYIGIVLAIFPVFIAVALGMKDRRARMQELIYSRKASSFKIVLTRYFSMIMVMFLPVLLMAVYTAIQVEGDYSGFHPDKLAFLKYSFSWLLPTLMVSTAAGVFLTELTDTAVAIAVQGLWWFTGLFAGMKHMDGGYGADLALRHNTIGNTQVYLENFNVLLLNRILYALFAVTLILFTVWIYELKRRGRLNAFNSFKKIFAHRHGKSKA